MMRSPTYTLQASNAAEALSATDHSPWAAICVIAHEDNTAPVWIGGEDIAEGADFTAVGDKGKRLNPDEAFWFGPAPNLQWLLTEIKAIGTANDQIKTICKRW